MGHRVRSARREATDPAWVLEPSDAPVLLRRRRGDRRPTPVGVRVWERDLSIPFDAFDLHAGGVFLRSELLLSVGDRLNLEISHREEPLVTVTGEVVEVVADPDTGRGDVGAGLLVAFHDLSLADLEALGSLERP